MADKPMKKYLPSLATRETKIKTTNRFHYTHMYMAKIKIMTTQMPVRMQRNWVHS